MQRAKVTHTNRPNTLKRCVCAQETLSASRLYSSYYVRFSESLYARIPRDHRCSTWRRPAFRFRRIFFAGAFRRLHHWRRRRSIFFFCRRCTSVDLIREHRAKKIKHTQHSRVASLGHGSIKSTAYAKELTACAHRWYQIKTEIDSLRHTERVSLYTRLSARVSDFIGFQTHDWIMAFLFARAHRTQIMYKRRWTFSRSPQVNLFRSAMRLF